MTQIVYDPDGPSLRMQGHAGAGEKGGDLVCAALSALMMTLERRMLDRAEQMRPEITRSGDRFEIRCRPDEEDEAACRESFETVAAGLTLLSENRPDCVQIRDMREEFEA